MTPDTIALLRDIARDRGAENTENMTTDELINYITA